MIEYTTRKTISDRDWDSLVEETYGRPYCLQQQDGCMDRQQIYIRVPSEYVVDQYKDVTEIPEVVNGEKMGVSFQAWLARDPKKPLSDENWDPDSESSIRLFWERNFYPDLEVIANDLYKKGLIEEGEYYIDIDW